MSRVHCTAVAVNVKSNVSLIQEKTGGLSISF